MLIEESISAHTLVHDAYSNWYLIPSVDSDLFYDWVAGSTEAEKLAGYEFDTCEVEGPHAVHFFKWTVDDE